MTLYDIKRKTLALIEELDEKSPYLTSDKDIRSKINGVISQIANELARIKKIPKYIALSAVAGEDITFADIKAASGYSVYQLLRVRGVGHELYAAGTVIHALEDGELKIDYFAYPEVIDEDTDDDEYVFELSSDALEIMPYGVAADLLKSDQSANFGSVYAQRYENMLQRLDPRYSTAMITFEGGVSF